MYIRGSITQEIAHAHAHTIYNEFNKYMHNSYITSEVRTVSRDTYIHMGWLRLVGSLKS